VTTLTITAKGQITVNKQLLAQLGAKPGDKLRARITAEGFLAA
jgi:bifunctional DNA-binding transcriptional regulator/antitoxin component of YhaV-PrlF toxin-antitoxin module